MPLTDNERRALEILRDRGPLTPGRFARLMWPTSKGWKHAVKCGIKGAHQGGGMYRAGGAYIGRLRKKGLATWAPREYARAMDEHTISAAGRLALKGE